MLTKKLGTVSAMVLAGSLFVAPGWVMANEDESQTKAREATEQTAIDQEKEVKRDLRQDTMDRVREDAVTPDVAKLGTDEQ